MKWSISVLSLVLFANPAFANGWIVRDIPAGQINVPVLIYTPAKKADLGLLIALHGWNLKAAEWKASGIERFAEQYGLLVVCPQMGIANYEEAYYRETTMKWSDVPSGKWIRDTLLRFVQVNYPISQSRARHGLIGVSTGGHGALLVAGYYPEDFGFAGMISGDFDVSQTPDDALARATFGPFEKFKDRWRAGSAISFMDSYRNVRVFVGHGGKDPVAPISQARLLVRTFAEAKERSGGYQFLYHEDPEGKHDWKFWRSQIGPAIEYFVAGFE